MYSKLEMKHLWGLFSYKLFPRDNPQKKSNKEVEYLHPADEREASEEPHGASYSRQLVHQGGGLVLQYVIEYYG